jgi:hypothetical protein
MELPQVCSFKTLTGLPCPGCGLTRSVVAAVHGDARDSLAHHRLGFVLVAYLALQALTRTVAIVSPWWRATGARFMRGLNLALVPLGIALMLNWFPTLLAALAG